MPKDDPEPLIPVESVEKLTDFWYILKMKFEWDERKAYINKQKHGISFDEAITAFDDPFALLAPDERHSSDTETREWVIGEATPGVLVVIFTKREKGKIYRLISARKANRKERKLYEQIKRIPI